MSDNSAALAPGAVSTDFWSTTAPRAHRGNFDALAWFRVLLRYKWQILLITALATLLAVLYVQTAEPWYRSTQSLLLESPESNIVNIEKLVERVPEDPGYVQTQIEILTSQNHARRVIDSLQLLNEPAFANVLLESTGVNKALLERVADGDRVSDPAPSIDALYVEAASVFLASLSVEQVPTTRIVRVSYLSTDRRLAAAIANEVGNQYILSFLETNRELASKASGWLGKRLGELKTTFEQSEQELLDFRRENQLVNVSGNVGELSEQELMQAAEELSTAQLALSNTNDLVAELERITDSTDLQELLPSLRADSAVRQTSADINATERELSRLANQYGPRNPRIVSLESELESLRRSLEEAIAQTVQAQQNEARLLTRQVASLSARLAAGKQDIQDIGVQRVKLQALEKEVQTNRDLYYTFFSRLIETRSTRGLESSNATIIETASPSLVPDKPDKALIVVLACIGSLSLAAIGAITINGFDDSIQSLDDVRDALNVRVLGVIPVYRKNTRRFYHMMRSGRPPDERAKRIFMEAFKSIRVSLRLGGGSSSPKVLLLTSSVPGEGKSMCSVCLARSYAQTERVLLIDADLRRPSLSRALGVDESLPGLTSLIAGQNLIEQCIQRGKAGGFDLLGAGPATSQPLEFLSSRYFEDLLVQLAKRYDRVIIDCAPVVAVSDAALLSRQADGVLFIVKSHDTSGRLIRSALDKLRAVHAPLAGVLLTQVEIGKLASYGAEYDYHDYQDHYAPGESNRPALELDAKDMRKIHSPRNPDDIGPADANFKVPDSAGLGRPTSAA